MACLVVRHKVFIPMYKPGLTCRKFVQFSHLAAFLKLVSHKTLKIASVLVTPHSGSAQLFAIVLSYNM